MPNGTVTNSDSLKSAIANKVEDPGDNEPMAENCVEPS